jgi:hypothetical protein
MIIEIHKETWPGKDQNVCQMAMFENIQMKKSTTNTQHTGAFILLGRINLMGGLRFPSFGPCSKSLSIKGLNFFLMIPLTEHEILFTSQAKTQASQTC